MKNFYIIVGCGGTGSNLAPMLSRMMDESDVMLLIDGDTVSVSNISRQTYQDFDVNKNKARSLAKKLNSCYQHQHFAIDRFLTSSDDLLEIVKNYKTTGIYGGGYGFKYFIIAAVDNNKARLILENAFLRMLKEYNSVYYIDSGNEDTYGTLFISDKKNQVLRSKMFEMEEEAPVNEHCDALIENQNSQQYQINLDMALAIAKVVFAIDKNSKYPISIKINGFERSCIYADKD